MPLRKQAGGGMPGGSLADVEDNNNYRHERGLSDTSQPPFLTLEETTTADTTTGSSSHLPEAARKRTSSLQSGSSDVEDGDETDYEEERRRQPASPSRHKQRQHSKKKKSFFSIKSLISYSMMALIGLIVWDALFTPPDKRWIQPTHTDVFLLWVQQHPLQGLMAIVLVIAAAVVVLIPIGTPLTLGCGYIYKGAYGWKAGLAVATLVSMGGSALGAVVCFLLGRYLFREQVRAWARHKYPLFDAIDTAASEHGLRIMAMLYLTPILPLGPVSYMCGTTSMALSSFVLAKIASLPLMLLYCFIGASTRTLLSKGGGADELKSIEENETLIALGILMSFVMIAGITRYIRKELHKILERQEKHKPGEKEDLAVVAAGGTDSDDEAATDTEQTAIELGHVRTSATRRRGA